MRRMIRKPYRMSNSMTKTRNKGVAKTLNHGRPNRELHDNSKLEVLAGLVPSIPLNAG